MAAFNEDAWFEQQAERISKTRESPPPASERTRRAPCEPRSLGGASSGPTSVLSQCLTHALSWRRTSASKWPRRPPQGLESSPCVARTPSSGSDLSAPSNQTLSRRNNAVERTAVVVSGRGGRRPGIPGKVLWCDKCRKRKIKCSHQRPCSNCAARGLSAQCNAGLLPPDAMNAVSIAKTEPERGLIKAETGVSKDVIMSILLNLSPSVRDRFVPEISTSYAHLLRNTEKIKEAKLVAFCSADGELEDEADDVLPLPRLPLRSQWGTTNGFL